MVQTRRQSVNKEQLTAIGSTASGAGNGGAANDSGNNSGGEREPGSRKGSDVLSRKGSTEDSNLVRFSGLSALFCSFFSLCILSSSSSSRQGL